MKPIFNRFAAFALLLLLCAGNVRADILVGRVIDKATGEPIPGVLFDAFTHQPGGGSYIVGSNKSRTDSLGYFRVVGGSGETVITFTYIGYHDATFTRITQASNKELNIGDIPMRMDAHLLKAVTVKGKRRQFYMHGDTVIYDPLAFNLKKGDRIAKLISRLPGVTVNQNGGLSWLGKSVVMLMNGRESIATSSFLGRVPAEAVKDIQVYDKTTNNWGDTVKAFKVLDVRIKPSWMERWYGEAAASGQTDRYYGLQGTAYNLSDKIPMQVGASMSDGDGVYDVARYSQQRVRRDKNTVTRAQQVRADYEKLPDFYTQQDLTNKTAQAYLNHSDTRQRSDTETEQYMSDGSVNYGLDKSSSYNHTIGFSPINLNYSHRKRRGFGTGWSVYANMTFNKNSSSSSSSGASFGDDPYALSAHPLDDLLAADPLLAAHAVNSSMQKGHTESDNFQTNAGFAYNFPPGKKHRNAFDIGLNGRYSDDRGKTSSTNATNYYNIASPSSLIDRQYSNSPSHTLGYSVFARWQKNGKGNLPDSYRLTYTHSLENNYDKHDIYRMKESCDLIDNLIQEFGRLEETPLTEYEKDLVNSSYKNQTNLGNDILFNYSRAKGLFGIKGISFYFSLGANHKYQRMHYRRGAQIDTVAHRNILLPNASGSLTKSINRNISLSYSTEFNMTATDFEQTMRYTDDTNPLYIVQGNPNLRNSAAWVNSINMSFNIPKKQIMATLRASLRQDYDMRSSLTYYNPQTGGYRTVFDNVAGGHTWTVGGTLDWKIAQKFNLRYMPTWDNRKSYRYLTVNEDDPEYRLNRQRSNDLVNNLNLRWYNDICEINFHANTSLRKYSNSEGAYDRYTYFDYDIGIDGSVEIGPVVTLQSELTLDGKNGYLQADMNKDLWLWDLSVAIRMLGGKGTLTLSAIDVLRQQTNRSYYVGPSSRSETRTYGLTDYYMISFSYMFGKPKKD